MINKIALKCIYLYQKYISVLKKNKSCRFHPTCSEYTYKSIEKHGLFKGMYYSIIRILKCHPFHPGGFDPVK